MSGALPSPLHTNHHKMLNLSGMFRIPQNLLLLAGASPEPLPEPLKAETLDGFRG